MDKINVGVVGCGYWGPNLIRNLRQLSECDLKLICDANEGRLGHMRRLYPGVETTARFEDLIEREELDAVVIATPVRFHYGMAKAALEAGKHVFIEKPMARTAAEAEELKELAETMGLVVMVGHTFLFSPAVRRMKEIVEGGDIGPVQYISARRLNLGLYQKDINVAWDLAPHDISIILYLLDEHPEAVTCQGSSHVSRGIEDVTMMNLTFARERCGFIHNSWLDPKKVRQMTVVGSKRMIVYDDTEPLEKLRIYDARVEVPPRYDTFAEFTYSYHYGDVYVPYLKQDEPLKLECQHFLECVREGKQPITGGKLGLEVVRILEGASKSLQQKGARIALERNGVAVQGTMPHRNGRARISVPEMAVAGK
jgi:predicted dehydrogenase